MTACHLHECLFGSELLLATHMSVMTTAYNTLGSVSSIQYNDQPLAKVWF